MKLSYTSSKGFAWPYFFLFLTCLNLLKFKYFLFLFVKNCIWLYLVLPLKQTKAVHFCRRRSQQILDSPGDGLCSYSAKCQLDIIPCRSIPIFAANKNYLETPSFGCCYSQIQVFDMGIIYKILTQLVTTSMMMKHTRK